MKNNDVVDLAPKRGRPLGSLDKGSRVQRKDHELQVKPGEVSKMVAFEMQWRDLPKVDRDDINSILDRIHLYFEECRKWDMRPGVAGMCSALGIQRSTWYYWISGGRRPEYKAYLEPIHAMLESLMEQYGMQGKLNPATHIFFLKNHFGYKDTSDLVLTKPNPTDLWDEDDPLFEERMRKKYLERGYDSSQYSELAAQAKDEYDRNDPTYQP